MTTTNHLGASEIDPFYMDKIDKLTCFFIDCYELLRSN